jgi:hypothetical protein
MALGSSASISRRAAASSAFGSPAVRAISTSPVEACCASAKCTYGVELSPTVSTL